MPQTGPVRVAMLVPLSGTAASTGKALLNAAQLALFDLADDRFTLMPFDTKGTPEGATEAATTAIGQGALLILGPLYSSSVTAVATVAQPAHVPVISYSTNPSVASANVYVGGFMLHDQAKRLVDEALSRGKTRFAVMAPDTSYGRLMAQAFVTVVGQKPQATLIANETFDPDDTNQITRVAKRLLPNGDAPPDFDVLMVPQAGQKLKEVLALLAYAGLSPGQTKVVGPMLWDDPKLFGERLLYGAWYPVPPQASHQKFAQRYQAMFGAPAPAIASLGYDTAALAAVLARQPRDKVPSPYDAQVLTNPNGFAGVDGVFRLLPNGMSERGLAVMEIANGTSQEIGPAPKSFAPTSQQATY